MLFALLLLFLPLSLTVLGWTAGAARKPRQAWLYGSIGAAAGEFISHAAIYAAVASQAPEHASGTSIIVDGVHDAIPGTCFGFAGGIAIDAFYKRHLIRNLALALVIASLAYRIGGAIPL